MKRYYIFTLIIILLNNFSQAQDIEVDSLNSVSIYKTGKESSLFYSTKYMKITNFAMYYKYSILYSASKFSFFLFDNQSHIIINECKVNQQIDKIGNKEGTIYEYIYPDKSRSLIRLDNYPVNFSKMHFISDSIIYLGPIFGKKDIRIAYAKITNTEKIKLFTKKINPLVLYKDKIKKWDIKQGINELKLSFHIIKADTSKIIFYLFSNLNNHFKDYRINIAQRNISIYSYRFSDNKIKLLYEKNNHTGAVADIYRFSHNGKNIIEYLTEEDSIIIRDDNFKYINGLNIFKELHKYKLNAPIVRYRFFIKNEFTNQSFLLIRNPVKTDLGNYMSEYYVFALKLNYYTSEINFNFIKKIISKRTLDFKEVFNNKLFYKYKRSRDKNIYTTNLYGKSDIEKIKRLSFVKKEDYSKKGIVIDGKYKKINKRKTAKVFGKIKRDDAKYPVNTIRDLINTDIKCLKEHNWGYKKTFLQAYKTIDLEQLYIGIDNGEYSDQASAILSNENKDELNKGISFNKLLLSLIDTKAQVFITDKLCRINISKTESKKTYVEFVKINNRWYFGYTVEKDLNDTDK